MSIEQQEPFALPNRFGKRVRIISPDGLASHTQFIDIETGESLPRIQHAAIEWHPGATVRAYLTTNLAQTDVLTEAEIERTTPEIVELNNLLERARNLLAMIYDFNLVTDPDLKVQVEQYLDDSASECLEEFLTRHRERVERSRTIR